MKVEFERELKIPRGTAQTRRFKAGGKNWAPESLKRSKALWQALFEGNRPPYPFSGPLRLCVRLVFHGKSPGPRTKRPDGDNLLKVIKDAMMRAGWCTEDSLIYDERIIRLDSTGKKEKVFIELKDEEEE